MSNLQRFGQLIRETRERRGLKSEELAQRIGVSKSVMSYIETARGKSMPEPELVATLADVLGLPRRALLEALGYLEPEGAAPAGAVITLPADDPRAEVVRLLADVPDDRIAVVVATIRAQLPLLVAAAPRPGRASQAS